MSEDSQPRVWERKNWSRDQKFFTGFWGPQPEVIVPDLDPDFYAFQSPSDFCEVEVISTFDLRTRVHPCCDLQGATSAHLLGSPGRVFGWSGSNRCLSPLTWSSSFLVQPSGSEHSEPLQGQHLIVAGSFWNVWVAAGPVQILQGILAVVLLDCVIFVFAVIVVGVQVLPTLDLVHCIFREQSTGYKAA